MLWIGFVWFFNLWIRIACNCLEKISIEFVENDGCTQQISCFCGSATAFCSRNYFLFALQVKFHHCGVKFCEIGFWQYIQCNSLMTGAFRFFSERKNSTNTEIEVTQRFCGEKLTGIPGHQLFRSRCNRCSCQCLNGACKGLTLHFTDAVAVIFCKCRD